MIIGVPIQKAITAKKNQIGTIIIFPNMVRFKSRGNVKWSFVIA